MYCPTTDKRMILENGELVEPPEDDEETGSSFCGCFSPVQEPNTEDVALTVINEQEVEVELEEPLEVQENEDIQIVKNIIEELISDVVVSEYEKKIEIDQIVEYVIEKLLCDIVE